MAWTVKGESATSRGIGVDPEYRLIAAVLRVIVDDPDYLRDPCGIWWARMAGLDPEYLWAKAVRGTTREGRAFRPFASHSTWEKARRNIVIVRPSVPPPVEAPKPPSPFWALNPGLTRSADGRIVKRKATDGTKA